MFTNLDEKTIKFIRDNHISREVLFDIFKQGYDAGYEWGDKDASIYWGASDANTCKEEFQKIFEEIE